MWMCSECKGKGGWQDGTIQSEWDECDACNGTGKVAHMTSEDFAKATAFDPHTAYRFYLEYEELKKRVQNWRDAELKSDKYPGCVDMQFVWKHGTKRLTIDLCGSEDVEHISKMYVQEWESGSQSELLCDSFPILWTWLWEESEG